MTEHISRHGALQGHSSRAVQDEIREVETAMAGLLDPRARTADTGVDLAAAVRASLDSVITGGDGSGGPAGDLEWLVSTAPAHGPNDAPSDLTSEVVVVAVFVGMPLFTMAYDPSVNRLYWAHLSAGAQSDGGRLLVDRPSAKGQSVVSLHGPEDSTGDLVDRLAACGYTARAGDSPLGALIAVAEGRSAGMVCVDLNVVTRLGGALLASEALAQVGDGDGCYPDVSDGSLIATSHYLHQHAISSTVQGFAW
jgi:hypothetical protein